jgi:hypothetical protein
LIEHARRQLPRQKALTVSEPGSIASARSGSQTSSTPG